MIRMITVALVSLFLAGAVPSGSDERTVDDWDGKVIGEYIFSIDDVSIDPDRDLSGFFDVGLPDTERSPLAGKPALPIILNPVVTNTRLKDIKVTRERPVEIPLPGPITPAPTPIPITEDSWQIGGTTADQSVYESDDVFPEEPLLWSYTGSTWEDGTEHHRYSVSIYPVDYQPGSNNLILFRKITLTAEEDDTVHFSTPTREPNLPGSVIPGTELLIVAPDPYLDALGDYVDWKREKGISTTLAAFSDVDSLYSGSDGPSSLWMFIHDTYFSDDQKLKYVLLVGEPTLVPTRMVHDLNPYGQEPDELPSDTYFACLGTPTSGPSIWNGDGDSYWGEVEDIGDFHPEVYVSRIALNGEAAVSDWVKKIMAYEKNPSMNEWYGRAGMFGSDTHQTYDGANQCDYLWDKYLDTVYTEKDPYYSDGHYGSTPLTGSNIRNGINSGFGVVVYMGHGLRQWWSEGLQGQSTAIMSANDAYSIDNSPRLPYVTAMSCETNWFDGSYDSISEGFTENPSGGALGYVGASRTTWGAMTQQYYPDAPGFQEDVLRMINRKKTRTAEIFHEAKSHYVDSFAAYFSSITEPAYNTWMEHNLLGPAETELWFTTPKTFSATYDYVKDYYTNVSVTVKNGNGQAVPGATVTVYSDNGLLSTAETNSNGMCKVPYVIDGNILAKITVVKSEYRPFQTDAFLMDTTPPETAFDTESGNPDGANGWYISEPGIRLISSEPGNIYYSWNGGGKVTYNDRIPAPPGENQLEFWCVDLSGNEEEPKTATVKYDPYTPEAVVGITPEEPDGNFEWYKTKPEISVETEEKPGSPQWVDFWWDRERKQKCNGTIIPPEGDHVLHIQAVDEAGNRGDELSYSLKVDSIVPRTTVDTDGVEPNENGWYDRRMSVTLESDDNRAEISYRWDDQKEWIDYDDPLDPLPGNHTLRYRSEDVTGNIEGENEMIIRYDINPPNLECITDPAEPDGSNGWFVTEPSVELKAEESEGIATIYYRSGDDPWTTYTSPIGFRSGINSISCYAEDEAGNRGMTQDIEIKVDTKPARTEGYSDISYGETGWYTEMPLITLSSDEKTDIFYRWGGEGFFLDYTGALTPPEREGEFELQYKSVDEAGNEESVKYMSILVDAGPPQAKCANPPSALTGEAVTFDLSDSIDGIGIDGYFIDFGDGSDSGWSSDPVVEHEYSDPGLYEVEIKVRDSVGHESEILKREIRIEDEGIDPVLLITIMGAVGLVIILAAVLLGVIIRNRTVDHIHHPEHIHHHHLMHGQHARGSDVTTKDHTKEQSTAPGKRIGFPATSNVAPSHSVMSGSLKKQENRPIAGGRSIPPPPRPPGIPKPPMNPLE